MRLPQNADRTAELDLNDISSHYVSIQKCIIQFSKDAKLLLARRNSFTREIILNFSLKRLFSEKNIIFFLIFLLIRAILM